MIEEMGVIFRKVLLHEENNEYKECHDEIDIAMKKIGVPGILARTMPAEEIIRIVRRPGSNGDERCFMLSRLIAADAHVYNSEGKNDVSHNLYTTSLGILKELEKDAEGEKLEQYQKEIDEIRFSITENAKDDVRFDM